MKERVNYIDWLRTIGIILMVLAHIPLSTEFVHWTHGFHMPLFFVISGFLYSGGRNLLFKKNYKKMIVPYLSFSVIGYILWLVEMKPKTFNDALNPLKSVIWNNSERMPVAGALWFLTSMIFVNVFAQCIENFCKKKYKWLVVATLFCVGIFETKLLTFRLPWSMGTACVGIGYFYAGRQLKRKWNSRQMDFLKKLPVVVYLIILFGVSLSIANNGILNMRKGTYACIPVTIINSLVFIFDLWIIVYRMTPSLERYIGEKVGNEIRSIGRFSVVYLCCNELVINVVRTVFRKIGITNLLITVLMVAVILKICEKVFTKTQMSVFIGNKVAYSRSSTV